MALTPANHNVTAYYKTVATSSKNKSYAYCLGELQTAWSGLTDEERANSRIKRGTGIYPLVNSNSSTGVFCLMARNNTTSDLYELAIMTATYYTGASGSITDKSTSNNSTELELQILACM